VTAAGKWRDENPEELDRLRGAVKAWRDANPEGTEDEMVAELAGKFRSDWPDRDESTRAAVDAVITARTEQRRNSGEATAQRRRSAPS
jgi:hypothetical protein